MQKSRVNAGMLMAVVAGLTAASAGGASVMPLTRERVIPEPMVRAPSGGSGKGRNKHPRSAGKNRAFQRLALKKRNRARHRKACR